MNLVNLLLLAAAFASSGFSAVLPDQRRSTIQHSQTVCNGGLCFESFTDSSEDTTVGFILPELTPGGSPASNELIVKLSFSLPYGFAGPSLGNLVKQVPQSLNTRVVGTPISILLYISSAVSVKRTTVSQMVAQLSIPVSDDTLGPFGNGVTATVSPLSTVTDDRVNLIVHVQGFSAASGVPEILISSSPITLNLIMSDTQPEFLGTSASAAKLPLSGSEQAEFILNTPAARTENFKQVLRAAGFS